MSLCWQRKLKARVTEGSSATDGREGEHEGVEEFVCEAGMMKGCVCWTFSAAYFQCDDGSGWWRWCSVGADDDNSDDNNMV